MKMTPEERLKARHESHRRWRQKNVEFLRIKRAKYYAENKVKERQKAKEWQTNNPMNVAINNRIIPLVKGGLHCDTNIQLLCPMCNRKKGSRSLPVFMKILESQSAER